MRTAIFPGTFDPFTIGHDALVHRALSIVDELYIAIGIIRVAVAVRLVKRNAIRIVLIHKRSIGTHVLFP